MALYFNSSVQIYPIFFYLKARIIYKLENPRRLTPLRQMILNIN
jgi:hypothetical protein